MLTLTRRSFLKSIAPYKSNLKVEGEGYIGEIYSEAIITPLSEDEPHFDKFGFEIVVVEELSFSCGGCSNDGGKVECWQMKQHLNS